MDDLSKSILDIVMNSIRAKSSIIEVIIELSKQTNQLQIKIIDNGIGMDKETIKKVLDPFYTTRTVRKVGLGLALFKQMANQANGDLKISSNLGVGTKVQVNFELNHINTPPFGDLIDMIYILLINQDIDEFIFKFINEEKKFYFSKLDLGMPYDLLVIKNIKNEVMQYLKQSIDDVKEGYK